jgi:hypothetical protein
MKWDSGYELGNGLPCLSGRTEENHRKPSLRFVTLPRYEQYISCMICDHMLPVETSFSVYSTRYDVFDLGDQWK